SPSTRSKKYLTALASKAVPSWNLTPLRSLKVHTRPSFDCVHDSASAGSICIFVLNRTRLSYIIRLTCSPVFDCVFCGSRLSGSAPAAKMIAPPAAGACAHATPAATEPTAARIPTIQSAAVRRIAHLLSNRTSPPPTEPTGRRIRLKEGNVKRRIGEQLVTSFRDLDQGHGVDQAVGEDEIAVPGDRGVAHDVATARNGPALKLFGLGVEAHDCVRGGPRFAVPDDVVDGGDPIGLGLWTARRRPFGHLASPGIEAAQISAREVRVPHEVVAGDRDAARTGCGVRQWILTDLEGLRIDAPDLVGAEGDVKHNALRVHGHALGPRLRGMGG